MKLKKSILKLITSMSLAVTMIAAPMVAFAAGSASVGASVDNAAPKAGEAVAFTVTISGDTAIEGLQGSVVASDNLTYVSSSSTMNGLSTNEGQFAGFTNAGEGTSSVTITYNYTVSADAAEGAELSFAVSGLKAVDANADTIALSSDSASASAKVAAAATVDPTPDDPTPDEPTPDEPTPDQPTPSDPTPSNPQPSTPGNQTNNSNLDDVPKTGDASANMMVYAVVAIAAAGAIAVVSAKKFAR